MGRRHTGCATRRRRDSRPDAGEKALSLLAGETGTTIFDMIDRGNVTLVQSGPSFELWKGPNGGMRLEWTRRGAVRFAISGYGYEGYVPPILARWNDAITLAQGGRVDILVDFWDLEDYDSSFRVKTQDWGRAHLDNLGSVGLLTRSKLISMAAAITNAAIGGKLKTFTQRAEFQVRGLQLGFTNQGAST